MSEEPRGATEFWADLRRHPAFQGAVLFGGGSWLMLQAADVFGVDTSTVRLLGAVMIVIFLLLVATACMLVLRRRATGAAVRQGLNVRYVAAFAVVLLLLGTGAWVARPYVLKSAVRAGADVIVVLPFQASGAGVELLGEGLVDLLSTNLDEVGAIRTVNPRTTLHQYRQHAVNGSIDLDGALRVGRAVGAGSVLLGSVVSAGSEARISAELHAVQGGNVIARAQKSGPAENVLALVDELSVELMRDIWRSREALPQLRVSAITTSSVPAIRAYLRGEQFYRRVQWDSARVAFNAAIEHDSTFALAHFRLAEAYGWSESVRSGEARLHSHAATRFADRLPARERALVLAHRLHEETDVASIDAFTAYTARYPDDATGWYMLADARFHGMTALGLDHATVLASFERVHELDPTYAQPYAHMLELTVMTGDSARFDRYLAQYGTLANEGATAIYHTLRTIRWAPRAEALAAIETALQSGAATPGSVMERIIITATARAYGETPDVEFFTAMIQVVGDAMMGMPGAVEQTIAMRAGAFAAAGRFREAQALLDTVRNRNSELAMRGALPTIVTAAAPDHAFPVERDMLAKAPPRRGAAYWRSVQALTRGDAAAAAREIEVVKRDSVGSGFELNPTLLGALDGWLAAVRGDAAEGMLGMRRAILNAGYSGGNRDATAPLRAQLGLLLLQSPDPALRREGLNRLEQVARYDASYAPLVIIPIAEAYGAAGDVERAALWYNRFITLWQHADPELQPQVEAARRALARLRAA